MTEDFLHYIWKYKLIGPNLQSTSGVPISVIDPGRHNTDAGPDFFNARIRIGDTLWAGNVEIHINASDWIRHQHDNDPAFDNVVLHVVSRNDKEIFRRNGEPLPSLELSGKIDPGLYSVYQQLMLNRNWIPCAHLISYASRLIVHNWLDRMLVERFDRKASEILQRLSMNKNDWNETFYQSLAKSFGFKTNALPFELLSKSIPWHLLRKHSNSLFQVESLLFGQAGMLSFPYRGVHYIKLKKEYEFLAARYKLTSMDYHLWKFLRMRPSNFPTLRIAQFAALLSDSAFLFSHLLETESLDELQMVFIVKASEFWNDHYTFKTRSPKMEKSLGDHAIRLIIINTLVPFLYVYGKIKNRSSLIERSLKFLDQLPGESNHTVKGWRELGLSVRSAYSTQALIELKDRYCQRKRCLECAIGNSLLKNCISPDFYTEDCPTG